MSQLRRLLVALAACLIGVTATIPIAVLDVKDRPPPNRVAPAERRQLTTDEMAMIMGWCVVFYAVTYYSGTAIYRRLGAAHELDQVQQLSRAHLAVLEIFGGFLFVGVRAARLDAMNRGNAADWLMIAFGVALIVRGVLRITTRWR